MKVSQLVKALRSGNPEKVNALIQDRKAVSQSMLESLRGQLKEQHIYIDKDDMGQATWYYVWRKENYKSANDWDRVNLGCQFFWNEGEYDANGEHSLYNEYGFNK